MKLHSINLRTTTLDFLSIEELCELFVIISRHILFFIGEGLFNNHYLEDTYISETYQKTLLCFEELCELQPFVNADSPTIKVHGFTYISMKEGSFLPPVQLSPNQPSFLDLGPVAFAKLFMAVVNSLMRSLNNKIPTMSPVVADILVQYIKEGESTSTCLYRLCKQIPGHRSYPKGRNSSHPVIYLQLETGIGATKT
jgi:hypothetical protein